MSTINTHCELTSDGKHSFYNFHASNAFKSPFIVNSFHTCVTCGHRRALDVIGNLWWYDADEKKWYEKHDMRGVIE